MDLLSSYLSTLSCRIVQLWEASLAAQLVLVLFESGMDNLPGRDLAHGFAWIGCGIDGIDGRTFSILQRLEALLSCLLEMLRMLKDYKCACWFLCAATASSGMMNDLLGRCRRHFAGPGAGKLQSNSRPFVILEVATSTFNSSSESKYEEKPTVSSEERSRHCGSAKGAFGCPWSRTCR
jgi:hypothetical protein